LARQESGEHIDVILVGTGSEVSLCIDAAKHADLQGKSVRVVSFPSWTLFEEQSQEYKYVVRVSTSRCYRTELTRVAGATG